MKKKYENYSSRIVLIFACIALVLLVAPAMAASTTTSLHIVKYASDGTTKLGETTKTYQDLMAMPQVGDGITEYYHQNPTMVSTDIWNDAETINLKTKGIVKGTDLKLICDLVGGMNPGDTVTLHPADDFGDYTYPYEYVYTPNPRQGPMAITWYFKANQESPVQYPDSGYTSGMRLVMMAQTTNLDGKHVFGDADMRDSWAPSYWTWYDTTYPSTNKASMTYVQDVIIHQAIATPEFPTMALPAALIVGLIGTVLFVQRYKEN